MVSTRASTSIKNPGLVDAPRPRRRTSAVKAEKEMKAAEKAEKDASRAAKERKVDELEAQLIVDQASRRVQRTATAAHPLRRQDTVLLGEGSDARPAGSKRRQRSESSSRSTERKLADTSSAIGDLLEVSSPPPTSTQTLDPDDLGYETASTIIVTDNEEDDQPPPPKKIRPSLPTASQAMALNASSGSGSSIRSHSTHPTIQQMQPPVIGITIADLRRRRNIPLVVRQWLKVVTDTGLYREHEHLPIRFATSFPEFFYSMAPAAAPSGPAQSQARMLPRTLSLYHTATPLAAVVPPPRTLAVPATPYSGAPKPRPVNANGKKVGKTTKEASKSKAAEQVGVSSSGYVDSEDESPEGQAAKESPAKHGARLTSKTLVKCEEDDGCTSNRANKSSIGARPSSSTSTTAVAGPSTSSNNGNSKDLAIDLDDEASGSKTTRTTAKNSDLPKGYKDANRWRGQFLPTVIQYLGTRLDPWDLPDSSIIPVLQSIWDAVYGDTLPWTVTINDGVHAVAMQRIYEWRSYFGSSTLSAFELFFESSPAEFPDFDSRAVFCKQVMTAGQLFYESTENGVSSGLYRSTFVLAALSEHQDSTRGAVHVPRLYPAGSPKFPYGAIGLAAAAAWRAATLFRLKMIRMEGARLVIVKTINKTTGKPSKETAFSEANNGSKTRQCAILASRLTPDKLEMIVEYASQTVIAGLPADRVSAGFYVDDVENDFTSLIDMD